MPTMRQKCIFLLVSVWKKVIQGHVMGFFAVWALQALSPHCSAVPRVCGLCSGWRLSLNFLFQAVVEEKMMKLFKNTFPLSYMESPEISI